jgi:hypothetical protein
LNFKEQVKSYRIDLRSPEQNIAIEIDENGHKDRNESYEQQREKTIADASGCNFLGSNPDEAGF